MADNLYRSYSLEKSLSNGEVVTSGTLTAWEDSPTSRYNIGDTFRPVPNGPLLTVNKVNITDNVIGEKDGKPIRQWQVNIEGSDEAEASQSQTHVLYNFTFNADEHSGTMEVTNTGDTPAVTLNIGDMFNVPGIGRVPCIEVRGADSYDDNGAHVWTVTYQGSDATQDSDDSGLDEDRHNFSIEQDNDNVVHYGSVSVTVKGDNPPAGLDVGSLINVPGVGNVTCTKISGSDEVNDKGERIWTITYEGSDAVSSGDVDIPEVRYSFSVDTANSGSMQVVNEGNAPSLNLSVGSTFNIPGIGRVKCSKVSGSDDYTDSGVHRWTVTYEGTDAEEAQQEESLPEVKYSFSVDTAHSGSMQVVNTGDAPAISLEVGSEFAIPGIGHVKCTKISGADEYTDAGTRRWTVTYEGSDVEGAFSDSTKYSFSTEISGDNVIHSGAKQVVSYGDAPIFAHNTGSTFTIPGVGEVTCTKVNGSDEFTDEGLHRWTVTYEGTDAPSEAEQGDSLPETKYSLAIEKDSDGLLQKSGSKVVVNEGDNPALDIQVGSTFTIPGIGSVTCSKVSGSDDYTDSGLHRWTMTYEGVINDSSGGEEQQDTQSHDTKYNFSVERDNDGSLLHSGSVEITTISNTPPSAYQVGSVIDIPGVGEVTCVKVSGSDSYTENGRRKWVIVYEGSDSSGSSGSGQQETGTKYSFDIENNSDGVTVYSGTMEVAYSGSDPAPNINLGDTFSLPVVGALTCTKVRGSDDGAGNWTFTIEGTRTGGSSGEQGQDDSSLPDDEVSVSYELNGVTVRTVDGEFVALRRSQTPITKKSITVYTSSSEAVAVLGETYQGGIALSENIIKESTKVNGVETGSYYKHTIEVEA